MGSVGCRMGGASPPILSLHISGRPGIASRMLLAHGRGVASRSTLSRVGGALVHKVGQQEEDAQEEEQEEGVSWLARLLRTRTTRYS